MEALKGLYHADKLDEQSFIDNFTIRLKEYEQIKDNLLQQKQKPLQHFLVTGKRGMGKSTLLRRLFIEASGEPLNKKLFAVRLGSEQYKLSRLYKLWEQVIEHLGQKEPKLPEQKKAIEESKDYENNLIHIIADYLKETGKTLLLLIDNFDQFIEKIPLQDQHALREALMVYPIQIIGNTVFYNEHFVEYDKPFFDFFKPVRLDNLDKEEAEEFIKMRAAGEGIANFDEIFEKHKGKINALRILSGGVPRTLLILLGIILKKSTGDAVDYLHEMLEQVTPLYQDRMKSLSPQQQEIMHHLAMHWDRTPVKELAAEMRIPSKSISAQLLQLESSGYINKVDTGGRNNFYEIDERFFNIWLLMSEAAPYDAKRVIWLTRWLDAFYSNEELKDFAAFCQNDLKNSKPANRFLIAQALSESEKLDDGVKIKIVNETVEDLKDKIADVMVWADSFNRKLTDKEIKLIDEIGDLIDKKKYGKALEKLDYQEKINEPIAFFGKGLVYAYMHDSANAEKYYQLASANGIVSAMYNLAIFYEDEKKDIDNAEKYYLLAAEKGHTGAMCNLGVLYNKEKKDIAKAEKYYLLAVAKEDVDAIYNLAVLYKNAKHDIDNAEKYYLLAAQKGHSLAMGNLAHLYFETNNLNQKKEAYMWIRKAVEIENKSKIINLCIYVRNLLWNGKIKDAFDSLLELLKSPLHIDDNLWLISDIFQYFLVFKQKNLLYKTFKTNEQWVDRYKPVYYALMHEMQDEYPKEYLKMTEELQEPVNQILEFVKKEQERLGLN